MGARTGTKTPLAGQARVSQAAAASAPADDYFDRDKFNKATHTNKFLVAIQRKQRYR
jgi:hypothetical protein